MSVAGALVVDYNMTAEIIAKGNTVLVGNMAQLTVKILGGSGTGQTRIVTGWDSTTRTLQLETPFDSYFLPAGDSGSILALVGSFGAKAIVGNVFNWTEVVQWYSNTLGGVIADNSLTDCNVLDGGNVGNASVGAYGACYNGPGPVWFTEFTGNTQVRSDGIGLLDAAVRPGGAGNQKDCPVYAGAYIRWSVLRRNRISGISLAQAPEQRCGTISNSNLNSTDLLSEHNVIECPPGGKSVNANGAQNNWSNISCHHCLTRL
jgi:hypothetical protein